MIRRRSRQSPKQRASTPRNPVRIRRTWFSDWSSNTCASGLSASGYSKQRRWPAGRSSNVEATLPHAEHSTSTRLVRSTRVNLELLETRTFSNRVVYLRYRRA
jgi:hypothetical protein